ncbi:MAG: hypothetical protein IJ643_09720 [Eubacterium sp.]|nr:hypothetical protein [Eubacterium sp.]
MGIRIIDLKPLLKEMKMEKGKIYTFFGRPVIGKTQFAVEMTAFLWFNEGLKGTFITNEKKEKLAESIVKWENYHFLTGPDNLNYIFEKNSYDYEKINAEMIRHNSDFLVIDNIYQLGAEDDNNDFITHLKEIAQKNKVIIICTAPQTVRFEMGKPPKDLLQQAEQTPIAKHLIQQSDFVVFLDRWSYFNASYRWHYDDSMDFIIAKSNYKPTVVNIMHFRAFAYPNEQFCPKNMN